MEVYECIRARRTVRSYRTDAVPDGVIGKVLNAARWAPSSRNQQPWHFVVVTDSDVLTTLGSVATSGRFVADAPLVIAVVMDGADRPDLDAGRALQQMELVAWDEGLGTCFVNLRIAEENRAVKEMLGIPAGMELVALLPMGYRRDEKGRRGTPRKPLSEIAHRGRFGIAYEAS
jgi:nitroreductase